MMLRLARYSIGVGDRFAHQAAAQLRACQQAADRGVVVVPVWNKSNREHTIIGSDPSATRRAADAAVQAAQWPHPYHVDADHIRRETVERFLKPCDFFTIDVADAIGPPGGTPAPDAHDTASEAVNRMREQVAPLVGTWTLPGLAEPVIITPTLIERVAAQYGRAVHEAAAIYRYIAAAKGGDQFITEVSMDETETPQTPPELLVILKALAAEGIPLQTIAPKFTGRFNKGVDYVGQLDQFEREFRDDLAVIAFAIQEFGLPDSLKLSVHSGSDKFSLYPIMRRAIRAMGAGLHLKTAGTTWLEELIGLAEAGGAGLDLVKRIYAHARAKKEELCAPYATVIDIDATRLPAHVDDWSREQLVNALRHIPGHPEFNPHLRQLLHVGFKVAAQLGDEYLQMLRHCETTIAANVTTNLFERHIRPLFLDE